MSKQPNKLISILNYIFSTKNLDKRDTGIDLIKTFAVISVLSVHFLLNNGYYSIPMTETDILFPTAFRWLMFTGVPLFFMSTGYLKRKTAFNALHYVKILPIVITTFLVGGLTVLYKVYLLGESFPLFTWLRSIWAYEQPTYAWYVNIYLSLALIIPFLSYGWNAIESVRKKQMMIIVFAILTSLPTQINRWPVEGANFGFAPNKWTVCYAITYFLIGAYIAEYRPKIKKWVSGLLLLACVGYQTAKTYITADGGNFYTGVCADYEDLITVITGTVLFLFLYDIKINFKPVRAILASVSSVTLGLYLLSWIVDNELYAYHNYIGTFNDGVSSMPVGYLRIIPLDFAVCFVGATILSVITKLITNPIIRLVARKTQKPEVVSEEKRETVKV